MFLIRLGVVALVVLLFLPGPPRSHVPGTGAGDGFCGRYPKTCDASGEIGDALKYKLAFAINWAGKQAGIRVPGLSGGPDPADRRRADTHRYNDGSQRGQPERFDQRYERGTLNDTDRRPYWPDTSTRRDVYPGR